MRRLNSLPRESILKDNGKKILSTFGEKQSLSNKQCIYLNCILEEKESHYNQLKCNLIFRQKRLYLKFASIQNSRQL